MTQESKRWFSFDMIIYKVLPFQDSLQVYSKSFDQQLDMLPVVLEHGQSFQTNLANRMQALLDHCP